MRGSHSQVSAHWGDTAGPQIPAAAELLQWLFLIPKIFASLWLTEASRKRSILNTPPRAIINKLKVCWHLICCSHLKLHLEVEQHKVKLLPKAASGAAFLLLIKVIIFQIKHCSEPSRCMMQTIPSWADTLFGQWVMAVSYKIIQQVVLTVLKLCLSRIHVWRYKMWYKTSQKQNWNPSVRTHKWTGL